jgi:hypothetical protein
MKSIENFVLGIPYLFLMKVPYAWIFAVALWTWPPVVAGVLAAIIVLGLLLMALQKRFWAAKVLREYHSGGAAYMVQPRLPVLTQLRNVLVVLAGSALVAWVLVYAINATWLRLSWLQWFLLAAGFAFLYRGYVVFGPSTLYLVTSQGVGVYITPGHVDYRLFFGYDEMDCIMHIEQAAQLPANHDVLGPERHKKEGVLLKAKRYEGFSSEFGHILLTPPRPEEFLSRVPAALAGKASALIR